MGVVLGTYPALSGVSPLLLGPPRVFWTELLVFAMSCWLVAATGSALSKQPAPGVRLSARGRVVAMGLIGSALTCMAGTITTALIEGVSGVAWRTVVARLAVSYCAAAAVVIFLFPWLMPRLAARLESRATPPQRDRSQRRTGPCALADRSPARCDQP